MTRNEFSEENCFITWPQDEPVAQHLLLSEGPPSSAEARGHSVFPENRAGSGPTLETSLALRTSGQLAAEGTAPAPFFRQECEDLGSLGPIQASQNCCKTTAPLCLGHGATGGPAQPRSPTRAFAMTLGLHGQRQGPAHLPLGGICGSGL